MDDPEAVFDGIFDEDDEPADMGQVPMKAAERPSDLPCAPDTRPLAERQLQAEARCEILERNLSCLFTTARLEIQRKNDEIAHLRAMLEAARRVVTAMDSMGSAGPAAVPPRTPAAGTPS